MFLPRFSREPARIATLGFVKSSVQLPTRKQLVELCFSPKPFAAQSLTLLGQKIDTFSSS